METVSVNDQTGSDETDQDYHSDYAAQNVKHGRVLVWGSMSAKGVGQMTFIDSTCMFIDSNMWNICWNILNHP